MAQRRQSVGGRGNGRTNGAATMTTTNMVPMKWHWRHGQSDNQLHADKNGSETGQWPIAATATATKWGRNKDDNKYDSRGGGGDSRRQTSNKLAIGDLATYWVRWRQLLYEPVNNNKRQRGRW